MAKTAPKAKTAPAKAGKTKAEKTADSKGTKEALKPAKKAIAKAAAKPAAKTAKAPSKSAKAKVGKGDRLYCELCGLVVSVDETCGCATVCDIVCCGREMQLRN
jgi:hypothetical protein